jgi:hypothetical protein
MSTAVVFDLIRIDADTDLFAHSYRYRFSVNGKTDLKHKNNISDKISELFRKKSKLSAREPK